MKSLWAGHPSLPQYTWLSRLIALPSLPVSCRMWLTSSSKNLSWSAACHLPARSMSCFRHVFIERSQQRDPLSLSLSSRMAPWSYLTLSSLDCYVRKRQTSTLFGNWYFEFLVSQFAYSNSLFSLISALSQTSATYKLNFTVEMTLSLVFKWVTPLHSWAFPLRRYRSILSHWDCWCPVSCPRFRQSAL